MHEAAVGRFENAAAPSLRRGIAAPLSMPPRQKHKHEGVGMHF